jgi:hypothetical protein
MSSNRALTIIGAGITSLFYSWLPAIAAPDLTYSGQFIYKDSKDNIYIISETSNEITYRGVEVRTTPTSDACGYIKLTIRSNNSTFPSAMSVNGASLSLNTIQAQTKNPYKCKNGVISWNGIAPTGNFQVTTSNKGLTVTKNIYFAPTQTGGAFKQGLITYTADLVKRLKPNVCGFGIVPGYANSQKKTSSDLSYGARPINVATLPVNPNPPDCVRNRIFTSSINNVATFNGSSLYRTNKAIYLTNLTPRSINVVGYNSLSSRSIPVKNACGMVDFRIKFDTVPNSIKVGGSIYTPTTMPTVNSNVDFLDCANANYNALPADRLYKITLRAYVYKTSDLELKKLVVEVPTVVERKIPVNACGFASIPALNVANGFTAIDRVTINGSTPYTVTSLPLAPNPPICKNGVVYMSESVVNAPPVVVIPPVEDEETIDEEI